MPKKVVTTVLIGLLTLATWEFLLKPGIARLKEL